MKKKNIDSESKFAWNFFKETLLIPFRLLLWLLRRKPLHHVFKPFFELKKFLFSPTFTITIILVNMIIFLASGFFSEDFFSMLIQYPSDIFELRLHTLITAGFLHANLGHLIGNIIALFVFGRIVEKKLGSSKTALVYFGALILSGIFTAIIHTMILNDNTPGLGASGAIMGLVSTAILLSPFYITYVSVFPTPIMILGWLTILADISGVLNPVEDGIGHFAHLGGFISIAILLFLLSTKERKTMKKGLVINLMSMIIAIVIVAFF